MVLAPSLYSSTNKYPPSMKVKDSTAPTRAYTRAIRDTTPQLRRSATTTFSLGFDTRSRERSFKESRCPSPGPTRLLRQSAWRPRAPPRPPPENRRRVKGALQQISTRVAISMNQTGEIRFSWAQTGKRRFHSQNDNSLGYLGSLILPMEFIIGCRAP